MPYLYHGTTVENLPIIVKYGLRPHGRGLYVFKNIPQAEGWANTRGHTPIMFRDAPIGLNEALEKRSGDARPIVLRFPIGDNSIITDILYHNGLLLKRIIPREYLEVWSGGDWIPIEDFVEL